MNHSRKTWATVTIHCHKASHVFYGTLISAPESQVRRITVAARRKGSSAGTGYEIGIEGVGMALGQLNEI